MKLTRAAMVTLLFLLVAPTVWAQRTETKNSSPTHPSGKVASAPIPREQHQENTGGSDGAGLCVIASVKTSGEFLGLLRESRNLWDAARMRPGGYYDRKFDDLARRVAPSLKYAHYHGSDYSVLERLSERGLAIGITMDTGGLYGYRPIHHMVTGVHFDAELACYIDNNEPGLFTWVTREEWIRRSTLNSGQFWVLALLPSEDWSPQNQTEDSSQLAWIGLALAVAAGGVYYWRHQWT